MDNQMKKKIAIAIGVVVVIALGIYLYKRYVSKESYASRSNGLGARGCGMAKGQSNVMEPQQSPDVSDMFNTPHQKSSATKCQASLFGYNYQLPEELPSVESMMPEQSAYDNEYDHDVAKSIPYVFQYPFTGTILKSRPEQAGDMFRGDLMIEPEPVTSRSIFGHGDQLLHGAYSDFSKQSNSLLNGGNCGEWVKNTPISIENEGMIMN